MNDAESFRTWVEEVNQAGGTYHRMELGAGLVLDGEYDMARYFESYGIPDDLTDRTVLDVGTASGFFAFECARRGARVTAIDIHDMELMRRVRDGLGLDVTVLQKDLFNLDPAFGTFDYVICASLLLHVRDIVGALERVRSVCQNQAIVCTGIIDAVDPVCEFVGVQAPGGDGPYWTYWMPSMAALVRMMSAAGFSTVTEISRFTLRSAPGKNNFSTPHGVVRGEV